MAIDTQLAANNLMRWFISPDGDCAFSSYIDQLKQINHDLHYKDIEYWRDEVCKHISTNWEKVKNHFPSTPLANIQSIR